LEDIGDSDEHAIPLPNVSSNILQKVIEYSTHHKDDPPKAPEEDVRPKSSDDIDEWDKEFMKYVCGLLFV
ncbi:MAG: hypothetical protein SGCHY_005134, partial [Lobulomycetales sp.]